MIEIGVFGIGSPRTICKEGHCVCGNRNTVVYRGIEMCKSCRFYLVNDLPPDTAIFELKRLIALREDNENTDQTPLQ